MIPKIVHYCWISDEGNMSEDIKKCVESWHKYLPDYKFINWNDSNFDWGICEFTKHCRENNLYAYCSDYIRMWALYNYGGFYLDSDVMVYRSFDELLNLKRVLSNECMCTSNFIETAIMGCEPGDKVFGEVVDWYNNCKEKWTKSEFIVSPDVFTSVVGLNHVIKYDLLIEDIKGGDDTVVELLDSSKYFIESGDSAFAQHHFKGGWCSITLNDCLHYGDFKIFLCAHKPIQNYIPINDKYVIIDVSGTVKDTFHEVIDISQDEFVKEHNVCYSEGCAMRYLYNHPEIIPDYICFGHYRRYFSFLANREAKIPEIIDTFGAIIKRPFDHSITERKTNMGGMYYDHQPEDVHGFIESVREAAPEYWNTFMELLDDHFQYACNCFAMKKEHFLEMCEMCFRVLDHFDKKMGYKNNRDVFVSMINASHKRHLRFGINWQSRLQGFWLEWLTDLYYRQKFGVNKCLKLESNFIEVKENNMIPRIIHYCWFGKGEKTKEIECIESWKKRCPDWNIIEWNEDNFNVNDFEYTKKAYDEKCWTKVSNFVRFWALYNYGGVYLDTDVMLFNRMTPLLRNECFFGLEYHKKYPFYADDFRSTLFGTAIIGSVEKHETIGRILEYYKTKEFTDLERTPESNCNLLITNLFKDDILNNCTVYSANVLYPNVETDISYTKHLKFDSWAKDRI